MKARSPPRRAEDELSSVLSSLERAARAPNLYLVELKEAFRMENWNLFQNVYGDDHRTSAGQHLTRDDDFSWADRLKKSTSEIYDISKMLQAILEVADDLRAQLESSYEELVAERHSNGIRSLPDELLARIFQISVWGEDGFGARQAVRLSRVSRWFRNVVLGTRGLWTMLDPISSKVKLELLIARAGPAALFHAFFNAIHWNKDKNRKSIDIIRPTIPRWSTLTLKYDYMYEARETGVDDVLGEPLSLLAKEGLRSPLLEELMLRGDSIDPHFGGVLPSDIEAWAPNLRTLRCSYFLPSLSTPLSSISTLIFTQEISARPPASPLQILLRLLPKIPNLSSFELVAYKGYEEYDNESLPTTECSSLTSFQLRLHNFRLRNFSSEGSCIATLMAALRMPLLEDFSISVRIWDFRQGENESECIEWSQLLGHLSRAILPTHLSDPNCHRMVSVLYKLCIDELGRTAWTMKAPFGLRTLNLPLDGVFHIPSVTLSSCLRVIFTQESDLDSENALVSEHNESCRLRELKFIGCEYMTPVNLRHTVDSLEALGVWDRIERVVVQDCDLLRYSDVVNIVGERRLQYLDWHFDARKSCSKFM
ncbi:hypothetical protein SCHPADRAFT_944561 [Schizopora paradoxa]|uniref:Uncharacterized protein n=1 Tax=Schizopora paradoxa TaxID=27342 RepID=A0A0H2RTX2_9AGAM|nr:hypothetical protein SCHPADRAFT_944561 [Schizopora paradoxa]